MSLYNRLNLSPLLPLNINNSSCHAAVHEQEGARAGARANNTISAIIAM